MQIAYIAVSQTDVGNIRHPQLVGRHGLITVHKILPFVIPMVGVRRMAWFGRGQHQAVTTEQGIETVSSYHIVPTVNVTEHQPQFVASDTGILIADLTNIIQQTFLTFYYRLDVSLGLVPGLTATAKQTA
jgi:hypothetical protein